MLLSTRTLWLVATREYARPDHLRVGRSGSFRIVRNTKPQAEGI
jgi:hypothetical protein